MPVGNYDPGLVIAIFGGITLDGFAEGDMISVEMQGDGSKVVVGTAGEASFVKGYNKSAKITCRIMESAQLVNAALSTHLRTIEEPVPFGITSISTGAVMIAGAAKLERFPGVTYNDGVPVREWVILVAILDQIVEPVAV